MNYFKKNVKSLPLSFSIFLLFFSALSLADHSPVLPHLKTSPVENYIVKYSNDNSYNPDTDGDGSCDVQRASHVPAGEDGDFFSETAANRVRDALDDNHVHFDNLGFTTPAWRNATSIYDCSDHGGCDAGWANTTYIKLPAPQYICDSDASIRLIVGHELFHHVQYEAGMRSSKWTTAFSEGTARAMQDQVYTDIDGTAGLADGCCGYSPDVDNYLNDTNRNLFSSDVSYQSALFWKYATEQFGAWAPEPNLGTDFIVRLIQNSDEVSSDLEDLVETTINDTHPGRDLEGVFLDFSIANIAKEFDSSLLPDSIKYIYQDEQDGVSPAYGNVNRDWTGVLNPTQNDNSDVSRWGAKYYEADVSNCPDGIAGFRSHGDRAGYGTLVVRQNGAVDNLYKGISSDYAKAIILSKEDERDNPINRLIAIVAGLDSDANYEYDIACGQATLDIIQPDSSFLAYVGEYNNPERFTVRLKIQGPPELGIPTVQGLDASDFKVYVGAVDPANEATVISGSEVQGEFWLVAQAPSKPANGDFNLTVKLRTLATDSESLAIRYEEKLLDQVIVIDRSGSMMSPPGFTKMEAARNAASIIADTAGSSSQISSVSFGGDNTETNDDATLDRLLKIATDSQRTDVKSAILGIADPAPTVMTSIGDGLEKARNEFIVRGTTIGEDIITLLSDGMENEGLFAADVLPSLIAQGIEVHSIALGPQADQPLLQDLANQTGGTFYYVDVGTSSSSMMASSTTPINVPASSSSSSYPLQLRLADTYLASYEAASDSARIKESFGSMGGTQSINFAINESQIEDGRVTVAWSEPAATVSIKVYENNGLLIDGVNGVEIFNGNAHAEIHLPIITQGNLEVTITSSKSMSYFAAVSGKPIAGANMRLAFDQVLDPTVLSEGGTFKFGKPVRIVTFIDQPNAPITNVKVNASIKHPNGSTDMLPLFDDGAHHDGQANDGIYANVYRRTTLASPTGLADGSTPSIIGSYNVIVEAFGDTLPTQNRSSENFTRIIKASFNIFDGQESKPDRDGDGMPDAYEKSLPCLDETINDAAVDFDIDGLSNQDEWQGGTNPCEQDSDFGGIHDGSERILGLNPLDPEDDFLPRPKLVEVVNRSSEHLGDDVQLTPGGITIRYPTNTSYSGINIYRATTKSGPFILLDTFTPDGSSIYVDNSGVLGQRYYYKLQATGTSGAETAYSPIISGLVKQDPNPPIGRVNIAEGQTVTSTNVNLTLETDEPDVTHFRVRNHSDHTFSNWIPFASNYPWTIQPNGENIGMVSVQFKDASDNISLTYSTGAKVFSAPELGSIQGKIYLTGQAPDSIAGRMRIDLISNDLNDGPLAPVYTNEQGDYQLNNIPQGSYTLSIRYASEDSISLSVTVNGGSTTAIPDQIFDVDTYEFNTPTSNLYSLILLGIIISLISFARKLRMR